MNLTTFTIESVHGVKQTFVLGPTGQVDISANRGKNASNQESGENRRDQPEANKPR